jgi:predicted TIM-barrel fold metal-dependent hydrolase
VIAVSQGDWIPLVDAHLHPAHLSTLKLPLDVWSSGFNSMEGIYDADGAVIPEAFDAYLEGEGVDVAVMFCEYSPLTTGIHPIEDLVALAAAHPARLRFMANVNPHLHDPIAVEVDRQLALGAVGLKLHPVHARFSPNDAVLWPVYARLEEAGIPAVFHCGSSTFPGAVNRYADPGLVDEVAGAFPDLKIVLAHGGRGWWYDAAAFIALMRDNVWIDLSGLPPKKLPQYYRNFDLSRLGQKFIFATDWPGVPGIARNAAAVADLGFDRDTLEKILWRNAYAVYRFGDPPSAWG